MKKVADYGSWPSSITSDKLVGGNCKAICEVQVSGDSVFWVEQTFPLGKRVVYQHNGKKDGKAVLWTGEELNVKTTIHEYGGGAFIPNGQHGILIGQNGGIYELAKPLVEPRTVVEHKDADLRHADFCVHGDYVYAVREQHKPDMEIPDNLLIRAKISSGEQEIVATGADFYAAPRVSPDGKMLAWMEWNNPNMPWDQTTINVIKLNEDGSIGKPLFRLYTPPHEKSGVNYHGLQWSKQGNESRLYMVSDATGFWNVYEVKCDHSDKFLTFFGGKHVTNIHEIKKDLGSPIWLLADDRPYAVNSSNAVLCFDGKLWKKPFDQNGTLSEVDTDGFTNFSLLTLTDSNILYCAASGPKRAQSLIKVDLNTNEMTIIRETKNYEELEQFDISVPETLTFESDGVQIEGYFYPPYSSTYEAPPNTLPPVVLLGHGGPTGRSNNSLDLKKQYYTTRGFAVFDVNYRGIFFL